MLVIHPIKKILIGSLITTVLLVGYNIYQFNHITSENIKPELVTEATSNQVTEATSNQVTEATSNQVTEATSNQVAEDVTNQMITYTSPDGQTIELSINEYNGFTQWYSEKLYSEPYNVNGIKLSILYKEWKKEINHE